jgi:predicted O-methyltransferase YrrM
MMEPITITDPRIENYLYAVLPERNPVLQEMERQAKERDIPIVGPAVARLLFQYARLIQARSICELGSAIGYSTLWWAMALGDGGKVHYTDGSEKNAKEARGYFEQAGLANRIDVHVGDALDFLGSRQDQFDIVFCDVDKHDYPRAARMASGRVRQGGLFITDNTLWKGKLAYMAGNPDLTPDAGDAWTNAIAELNRLLYQSGDWFTTVIPLRDGVTVALRT